MKPNKIHMVSGFSKPKEPDSFSVSGKDRNMNNGDRVSVKTDKNSRNVYVENEKTKKRELLMLHSVEDPDYESDIEEWEYMLEAINKISFQKFKLVIVTPQ